MAQKTSINIKPCNIGSSEEHNRRTAEYLAHISKEKLYIRTDLMTGNETWVSPDFNGSLTDRYNEIAAMVKAKTGRAMQTKDRERVNKKTGKVTIVRGSTPLKEGVVVIKDDTTIEQLRQFCDVCKQRWGITALQIFIHRDEGHYGTPGDNATWKPNLHAHIVWDWWNHDTGKSCKLDEKAMREMQTLLAECLEMERGTSKEVTGNEHLERADFILAKQRQEAEQAKAEKDAAIIAKEEAEAERKSLDSEIAEKRSQADAENGNAILSGLANLVGRGKYAEIERRNQELEASVPREKDRLQRLFSKQVDAKARELMQPYVEREAEYKARQEELTARYNNLSKRYDSAMQSVRDSENRLKWRDSLLYRLADALYKAGKLFRMVIDAIIDFAKSAFGGKGKHGDIFTDKEAAGIKNIMDEYAKSKEERFAVGNWLVNFASIKGKLTDAQTDRAFSEVDDVAEGRYDWKIDSGRVDGISL
jgi:mobilization protein